MPKKKRRRKKIRQTTHRFTNRKAASRARQSLNGSGHLVDKVRSHPNARRWKYTVKASTKKVFAT